MIENIGNVDGSTLKKAATTSLKDDPMQIPGFVPGKGKSTKDTRVRFGRFNMSELADVAELEKIETKAIRGDGVWILKEQTYVFMQDMYYVVQYIEEVNP